MSRLFTQDVDSATGPAAAIFGNIKKAMGKVPNAYATIGNNSPMALEAALALDGALAKGSLSTKDIEAVKLAVSEAVGCDYCLAAHSFIAKRSGIAGDAVVALRKGGVSGDDKLDALATFARTLATTTGTVAPDVVSAVKAAGYTDQQIIETLLAIASITFTNLVNRVNDTPLDFPAAD